MGPRRQGTLIAPIVVGSLLVAPTGAQAANIPASDSAPVRVVAPGRDALVMGPSVRLTLRVRPRVQRVRAFLDGRPIKLRRASKGRLTTRVRSSGLRAGRHVFGARGRLGRRTVKAHRFFVVPGRRRDLLGLATPRRIAGRPLAVRARTRSPRGWFRAYLNGHRVDREFELPRRGLRRGSLSPSEGLRFGRNALHVRTYRADGSYETISRKITVRRARPLAAAGRDRGSRVGRRVTLDAGATRRTRPSAGLDYRWRFVRRPRGSRARLASPGSRRTTFRPDKRGRYRVRLTVTERPRRGPGARASQMASSASDMVMVAATPTIPPIGVPVNTQYQPGGQYGTQPFIQIAGTNYEVDQNGYTVVVLDRASSQGATLEVVNPGNTYYQAGEEAELATYVKSLDNTNLVIAASLGPEMSGDGTKSLNAFLSELGGQPVQFMQDPVTNLQIAGAFTIAGIPGSSPGSAYETTALPTRGTPSVQGMEGYLTRDSSNTNAILSGYTFAAADYVPFQLGANGMTVGCTQQQPAFCTQVDIATPSPGFRVAVLDTFSLAQVSAQAFGTDPTSLQNMATFISNAAQGYGLIMVQSVGGPSPSNTSWNVVANELAALGANWHDFNTLNPPNQASGPANYSFVGGNGLDPQEGYGSNASAPIALGGVLNRAQDWRFQPLLSDALSAFDYSLEQMAYQPTSAATAFPYSGGDYTAAEAYIAGKISCPVQPPPPDPPCNPWSDIRSRYWGSDTTWSTYTGALEDLDYQPGLGFTQTEFTNLQQQLLNVEWPAVDNVSQLMSNLYEPFVGTSTLLPLDVQKASQDIIGVVDPNPDDDTFNKVLETFEDVLSIGEAAVGVFASYPGRPGLRTAEVPEQPPDNPIADGTASALGAASAVFDLAATWTNDDNGDRILSEIQSDSSELAGDFAFAVSQANIGLARLRELLVSDYAKLIAAADFAKDEIPWDSDQLSAVYDAFWQATNQRIYKTLMPVGFKDFCNNLSRTTAQLTTGFEGDTGQVRPVVKTFALFPALGSQLASSLFSAPTYEAGDVNAGFRPSDFWTEVMEAKPPQC